MREKAWDSMLRLEAVEREMDFWRLSHLCLSLSALLILPTELERF